MNTGNKKRKIAETVVGAAVGALIAGPAGAIAGGLVGSQAAAHTPHPTRDKRKNDPAPPKADATIDRAEPKPAAD
jgi:hypothetical protein